MLLSPIFFAKASTERETPSAVRLLTTKISARTPAASKAFAVSYSQFVPGNTGMSAVGRAVLTAADRRSPSAETENTGRMRENASVFVGNTGSSFLAYRS